MDTYGSKATSTKELGFPVPALIGAVGGIASTVLPSVLGGNAAEERAEERRELIRNRRRLKSKLEIAKSDLEQLRTRLEREMTVDEAEKIRKTGAKDKRRAWWVEWRGKLEDLPGGETEAQRIAEEAETIYRQTADWVIAKSYGPALAGGAAAVAGGGMLIFSIYRHSQKK
jgi:hypothetical protein